MAVTTIPELFVPNFGNSQQNATIVTQGNAAVTSANVSTAAIIQAPKTGNISKIGVLIGTVSGSCTIDARIESLSGQFPSGTLLGTNSNNTQAVSNNTFYQITLTTPVAVTKGQLLAIVITYSAGTTINVKVNNSVFNSKFPYGVFKTAGTYAASSTPVCTVGYDDSTWPVNYPLVPAVATSAAYNNASTPDERGNIFTLPLSMRVSGIWGEFQNNATNADFDLVLYANDGTTALGTVSITATQVFGTSGGMMKVYFASPVTLLASTTYRVVVKPTTANSNAWVVMQASAAALQEAMPGGTAWYGTSRTDAGAWTDVTTDWYPIGILVDGIDTGAAGGMLLNSGMVGGIRG